MTYVSPPGFLLSAVSMSLSVPVSRLKLPGGLRPQASPRVENSNTGCFWLLQRCVVFCVWFGRL